MNIKRVKLEDLKLTDKFLLSFPLKPQLYYDLWVKLAHFPLIIVNKENEIIFGIDLFRFLDSQMIVETHVLKMDITDKEALFLNYNLKEKFTGTNLYEKLVFIKRGLAAPTQEGQEVPMAGVPEIYRRTGLDIAINRELIEKLDLLLSTIFRDALIDECITLKTGLKLCDFPPGDGEVLLDLFMKIPFTSSHQQKILEMTEELIARDKCPLEEIFKKVDIYPYYEMDRPQVKIVDALFAYRYPVYLEAEEKWQQEIKNLNLPGNIKVTHYPFFERKQLEVTVQVADFEEFKSLLKKFASGDQGGFFEKARGTGDLLAKGVFPGSNGNNVSNHR